MTMVTAFSSTVLNGSGVWYFLARVTHCCGCGSGNPVEAALEEIRRHGLKSSLKSEASCLLDKESFCAIFFEFVELEKVRCSPFAGRKTNVVQSEENVKSTTLSCLRTLGRNRGQFPWFNCWV